MAGSEHIKEHLGVSKQFRATAYFPVVNGVTVEGTCTWIDKDIATVVAKVIYKQGIGVTNVDKTIRFNIVGEYLVPINEEELFA